MKSITLVREAYRIQFRSFLPFLLISFGVAWYAFLIIGIPLIFIGGSALRGNLFKEPFPFMSVQTFLVALFLAAIKGPVEESGWRGLALPILQGKPQSRKSFQARKKQRMAEMTSILKGVQLRLVPSGYNELTIFPAQR